MVEKTTIVTVTKFTIRMVKVVCPRGYHLVVGGRLVSSTIDGVTTGHPDLPPYKTQDFPVDLIEWMDGGHSDVHVEGLNRFGEMKELSRVRAGVLLFTLCPTDGVRAWIKGAR